MRASKKRAIKYGRITKDRPLGHGGARGNGSHLSGIKEGGETERREESRIKKELQREVGRH